MAQFGHLSGSTNGKAILVVATSTLGTTIHTAPVGVDKVRLFATNHHTANVVLTIEWGGATDPNDLTVVTIPFDAGAFEITPEGGRSIGSTLVITAFAGTTNVITISGDVIRGRGFRVVLMRSVTFPDGVKIQFVEFTFTNQANEFTESAIDVSSDIYPVDVDQTVAIPLQTNRDGFGSISVSGSASCRGVQFTDTQELRMYLRGSNTNTLTAKIMILEFPRHFKLIEKKTTISIPGSSGWFTDTVSLGRDVIIANSQIIMNCHNRVWGNGATDYMDGNRGTFQDTNTALWNADSNGQADTCENCITTIVEAPYKWGTSV